MDMPYPGSVNKEGWGVYRTIPWHMHGIYLTESEADAEALKVGARYAVAYGSSNSRTGNFTLLAAQFRPPLYGPA